MESHHSFEAEIGTKPPGHNSTSMSYQGHRSINLPSSAISVPLYGHYDLRHKPNVRFRMLSVDRQSHIGNSQVYALSEEQDRMQPQLCGICRGVIYNESVCPHCRCDTAPLKEKTRFEQRDYFPEPNDVAAKSDLEDDLYSVVMSLFSVRPVCFICGIPFIISAFTRTRMKSLTTQTIWIWRRWNCRILRSEFCRRIRLS
jgi:hypothetical protein